MFLDDSLLDATVGMIWVKMQLVKDDLINVLTHSRKVSLHLLCKCTNISPPRSLDPFFDAREKQLKSLMFTRQQNVFDTKLNIQERYKRAINDGHVHLGPQQVCSEKHCLCSCDKCHISDVGPKK